MHRCLARHIISIIGFERLFYFEEAIMAGTILIVEDEEKIGRFFRAGAFA